MGGLDLAGGLQRCRGGHHRQVVEPTSVIVGKRTTLVFGVEEGADCPWIHACRNVCLHDVARCLKTRVAAISCRGIRAGETW